MTHGRSQEVDATEASESENSPKTENSDYSPDNRSDINIQLSPRSLEAANYRKRKIKALRETEFVKKCKHNYKCDSIIIHSSEDENNLEQGKKITRRPLRFDNTKTSKSIQTKRLPNLYSKDHYFKKNQDNCEIRSRFSSRNALNRRKRGRSNSKLYAYQLDSNQEIPNSTNMDNVEGNSAEQLTKVEDNEKLDSLNTVSSCKQIDSTESNSMEKSSAIGTRISESTKISSGDALNALSKEQLLLNNTEISSNFLSRTKSFESLSILSHQSPLKRSNSFDGNLPTNGQHSSSDLNCVSHGDARPVVLKNKERNSSCTKMHVKSTPIIVLERITFNQFVTKKEMAKCHNNLKSKKEKPNDSSKHGLPKPFFENDETTKSYSSHSVLDESRTLVDDLQSKVTESNGNESSENVQSSIEGKVDTRDDNSNSGFDPSSSGNSHKSSDTSTNSAPPSSSRPASPLSANHNPIQECRVKLERLNMNNLQRTMEASAVRSLNVPAYFLHLKDSETKLRCRYPSGNHFINIVNEGSCLKVISVKSTLEMFKINKNELKHCHLNIDTCRCPFSKKLNVVRGWELLKEELNRDQRKGTIKQSKNEASKPISKKIKRVVRSKMKPKIKTKLVKQFIKDSLRQIAKSLEDSDKNQDSDSRDWSGKTSKHRKNIPESSVIGKVRSMEMTPLDNTPTYICHQPVRAAPEFIPDAQPASPSIFPSDISFSSLSRSNTLLDFASVKGMIKQRKGQLPANKDYDSFNLNSFYDEREFNFRGNDHIVAQTVTAANDCLIRSDLLSEELPRCPLFNYNDFLKMSADDFDKVTDSTQGHLVESYNELMAMNNSKEKAMLNSIEKTISSDKRKPEDDESSRKKPRLNENSPSTSGEKVVESASPSISSNKGQCLRLKDASVLMAVKPPLSCQASSSSNEGAPVSGSWSRPERRQKKVSKSLELYLEEKLRRRREQQVNFREFSVSKLMGVALNHYPSHVDMSRTFNLDMVQQVHGVQNRILSLTKEGAMEDPVRVVDDQASKGSHQVWIPKKSCEERSNLLKSLSRLHWQHSVFTPPAPPPHRKTDQNPMVSTVYR